MTKEQAEFLYSIAEDLGTTGIECYLCEDGEKMREIINSLVEQQPSDDCVSRTEAKIDVIPNSLYTSEQVIALLDNLSPVTPTHGTCKDCKHFHNVRKDFNTCDLWTIACADNHYCADFEKRGNENG